ncbi:class I SAM-dependent methyltransferase [Sphingomonas colocasiae]|uniref:Class I SAM-dependent methyltransferase n=1 Tax=Sphingomonas colocasiae TaxID=1848973 RepID=A0ABS7PJ08_9SPHN|nr:class I SAM-dependent methyltransferase [Sphingomonas colocasiae]MBY8821238.1 class I SAM-dependent methyltransferase [Sphingomonas colocasiae]
MSSAAPPEIFDRSLRRRRRDRAAPDFANHDFLREHMATELLDRLDAVKRDFTHALDLGAANGSVGNALRARGMRVTALDPGHRFAHAVHGVQADEDRLPFADASFDLVVSAGVLDSVNDLPGALALIRRTLRPDGLFLGAMIGAGSLRALKAAALTADLAMQGGARPRIHPQIDVRAAGDLLARAGFTLPVTDSFGLDVRYPGLLRLAADLRGMAAGNLLAGTRHGLSRKWIAHAATAFAAKADPDGKTPEYFEIICMTGWSPGPGQPAPARRGSAGMSLAEALKSREPGGDA